MVPEQELTRVLSPGPPQSQNEQTHCSLRQVKTFSKYNLSDRELRYKQRLQRRGKEACSASGRKTTASRLRQGMLVQGAQHFSTGLSGNT